MWHSEHNLALVALGGNIAAHSDNPEANLGRAINMLRDLDHSGLRVSRLFRTPCFPPGAGPDFVNAAVRFDTALGAAALLAHLHRIEAALGRVRRERWGARVIDLDLLALGAQVLPDAATFDHWARLPPDQQRSATPGDLIVPHPRLHERAFVLVPLADVAPDWVHPVLGRSVRAMLAACPAADRAAIVPLTAACDDDAGC